MNQTMVEHHNEHNIANKVHERPYKFQLRLSIQFTLIRCQADTF